MNYALVGYGKMGRAIDDLARARGHVRRAVVAGAPPGGLRAQALGGADVAFEFTRPAAAPANVLALVQSGVGVVCGTTGWEIDDELRRAADAGTAAVVVAPNFSIGMNLFLRIVGDAAARLGRVGLYDPFVHEAHHRGKRDVPSGTARRLAATLIAGDARRRTVVEGNPAERLPADAVQISSTRAGSEPGRHLVGFDGEHELILLEHRSRGREGFALGAVLAAEWLRGRRGLHRFEEILDDVLERGASRTGGAGGEGA